LCFSYDPLDNILSHGFFRPAEGVPDGSKDLNLVFQKTVRSSGPGEIHLKSFSTQNRSRQTGVVDRSPTWMPLSLAY
jgi:hypothetical protein